MKIVCEKCGAKYQIPEEKVQGRVFKFNCKNCDEVIQVDNSSSSMGNGMDDSADWYIVVDDEQVGPITAAQIGEYISAGRFTSAGYVWKEGLPDWVPLQDVEELSYLNIQSLGASSVYYDEEADAEASAYADPYQQAQPEAYQDDSYQPDSFQEHADSSSNDSSYAGAGGFQSSEQDSSFQADGGGSFQQDGGADSYAGGSFQQSSFNSTSPEESGTFSSTENASVSSLSNFASSASTESTGGLFAAFDNPTSGNFASNSAPAGLVGQRNESSVLFSLSSLQQVSSQTQQKEQQKGPVTEGSGLIDLEALASAHSALGGNDEAADDPFASSTMALPPLAPMGSHKSNTPLIIGASIGAILLLGLLGLVIYLLMSKGPEPQPVAQQAPQPEKVIIREVVRENPEDKEAANEAAQAAAAAKAAAKKNEEEAKAAENDEEAEEENEDDNDSGKSGRKPSSRGSSKGRSNSGSSRSKKDDDDDDKRGSRRSNSGGSKRGSSKKDSIDGILDRIGNNSGGSKGKSSGNSGRSNSGSSGLSRAQVSGTIKKYIPRVISCGKSSNRNRLSGMMTIKFFIRPNGSVTSASVITPKFRNTDVSNCAVRVVSGMRFPSSNASENIPVSYPFPI